MILKGVSYEAHSVVGAVWFVTNYLVADVVDEGDVSNYARIRIS